VAGFSGGFVIEVCAAARLHVRVRMRIRLIELRMVSFQFKNLVEQINDGIF
jgi:hypothetical protein